MKLNKNPQSSRLYAHQLTSRESEVLFLVGKGLKSSEISKSLGLSENTVRVHRRNLYAKLRVKKPAGAVRKGFELGYLNI